MESVAQAFVGTAVKVTVPDLTAVIKTDSAITTTIVASTIVGAVIAFTIVVGSAI